MSKDINTVREALFDTLEKLKNKNIEIEQAKAIQEVSQTLLNSAKLELDFLKHTDKFQSNFFMNSLPENTSEEPKQLPEQAKQKKEEIDEVLEEIEQKRKEPYKFSNGHK